MCQACPMTTDDQEHFEGADSDVEATDEQVVEDQEEQKSDTSSTTSQVDPEVAEPEQSTPVPPTTTTPPAGPAVPYVSWGGRVLAYLIDVVPALIVGFVANLISRSTQTTSQQVIGRNNGHNITVEVTQTSFLGTAVSIIAVIVILAYWFWNKGYREGTTGKSIGKQALGFTTVDETTRQPIGAKSGCIRVLLLWVDFFICYIGVLWPLWDVKKQTFLSDRFTNAIVIRD